MKKWFVTALFFGLLSSLGHFYLAKRAYQLEGGIASADSICNIGENINCDSALLSSYAKIFGVSLSDFGLGFNLVLSALLILFLFFGINRHWKNISFYLAGVIALSSVAMAIISLVNSLFCPICWALYLFSFLILGLLFFAFKKDLSPPLAFIFQNAKQKNSYILGACILFISFFFHIHFTTGFDLKNQKEELNAFLQDWHYEQALEIEPVFLLQKGSGEADITLVEFADFLCSACKKVQPDLKQFLKYFPDIHFRFYAFPLGKACNPSLETKKIGLSCELSKAVVCANKQKKGWLMHDWIFEKQNQFKKNQGNEKKTKALLEKMLSETKINSVDFELCMQEPETLELVKQSALAGEKAQIPGTPSFFINGKPIPYLSLPILKKIYEQLKK